MAENVFRLADIQSYQPGIEPTRARNQFALGGRNYRFDSLGPKSSFGDRFLTPFGGHSLAHIQGVRLYTRYGTRTFTFWSQAIVEWDESRGTYKFIYVTDDTTPQPYRWTAAYLNQHIFFCHPAVGIVVLQQQSDEAILLQDSPDAVGIPDDPISICENNGRICVLSSTLISWSAPSNGFDYAPQLGGAGFQTLAGRVSGFPTIVSSYNRGILVWTTSGILRGEFAGGQEVYRFRVINSALRPINSFCTAQYNDDTVIILDEGGLFQTRGEEPQPLTPLFNEFLIEYVRRNRMTLGQNVRLEWDDEQRLLYVSVSLTRFSSLYEQAFVLYPSLDKWGQFNEHHHGIFPLHLGTTSPRAGDYYAWAGSDNRTRIWQEIGSREILPVDRGVTLLAKAAQKPTHFSADRSRRIVSSSGVVSSVNTILFAQREGYYPSDGFAPSEPNVAGLGASIRIGLFRLSERPTADAATEISTLTVRSAISREESVEGLDFNLVPPDTSDEDYESGTGQDDYGDPAIDYVNHGLTVIGTIDGVTAFDSEVPSLVTFAKGARYYSCTVTGVWHIVEMTAESVGEFFMPRTLEMTFSEQGRIN